MVAEVGSERWIVSNFKAPDSFNLKKNPMIGLDENTNLSCFDMQLGSHPRQRGGKSVLFFIVQDNKQKISCRKKM